MRSGVEKNIAAVNESDTVSMPYLIDGHNLIPKIPGLSLQDIDDELKLIQLLQDYTRITQTTLEVYFDHAPAGHDRTQRLGRVKVIFVSDKTIADEMIIRRVQGVGAFRTELDGCHF